VATTKRDRAGAADDTHPGARRRSRRQLRRTLGWFAISAGLAILAGLAISTL
jgi:hypothetical protein